MKAGLQQVAQCCIILCLLFCRRAGHGGRGCDACQLTGMSHVRWWGTTIGVFNFDVRSTRCVDSVLVLLRVTHAEMYACNFACYWLFIVPWHVCVANMRWHACVTSVRGMNVCVFRNGRRGVMAGSCVAELGIDDSMFSTLPKRRHVAAAASCEAWTAVVCM